MTETMWRPAPLEAPKGVAVSRLPSLGSPRTVLVEACRVVDGEETETCETRSFNVADNLLEALGTSTLCLQQDVGALHLSARLASTFIKELALLAQTREAVQYHIFLTGVPMALELLSVRSRLLPHEPLQSSVLLFANELQAAAACFLHYAAVQHTSLITLMEQPVFRIAGALTSLYLEGRPEMLLHAPLARAQRSLIATLLALCKSSWSWECLEELHCCCQEGPLVDHLTWLWRLSCEEEVCSLLQEAGELAMELLGLMGMGDADEWIGMAPPLRRRASMGDSHRPPRPEQGLVLRQSKSLPARGAEAAQPRTAWQSLASGSRLLVSAIFGTAEKIKSF